MDWNKIARFTLIFLVICFLNVQCKDSGKQPGTCNCQSISIKKNLKNIEAVVIYRIGNQPSGNQSTDQYILSTEPKDFDGVTYSIGENLLVPCGDSLSLPVDFRKHGLRVNISYKRKDCYGALTSPDMRKAYGYYIELTAIRVKNP